MTRLACAVALLFVALPASGQDAKKDQEKIQGTWDVVEFVINGRDVIKDAKDAKGTIRLVFAGDKLSMVSPEDKDKKRSFTFKLDPSKKPAAIDTTALEGQYEGKTVPGIYQLDGDTLKLCIPNKPEVKQRPAEFDSKPGDDLAVFTLKRAKP